MSTTRAPDLRAFPDAFAVNSSYRDPDGAPGPDYWQNRADYKIAATLDPVKATLNGDETITYTNNSPSALTALWVQLDENIYAPDARARYAAGSSRRAAPQATAGFVLDTVEIGEGSGRSKPMPSSSPIPACRCACPKR